MSKLDEMLERDAKIREIQAPIYMSRSNMGLWMRLLRWFWRKITVKTTVACVLFFVISAAIYLVFSVLGTENGYPFFVIPLTMIFIFLLVMEVPLALIKGVIWLWTSKQKN